MRFDYVFMKRYNRIIMIKIDGLYLKFLIKMVNILGVVHRHFTQLVIG